MATAKKASKKTKASPPKENIFQKLSLWVFAKYRPVSIVMFALVVAGLLSYGVFLRREGFPSIQTPIALGTGAYFVDDAQKIDQEILIPTTEILVEDPSVDSVETSTDNNIFSVFVGFEESVSSERGSQILTDAFAAAELPKEAQVNVPTLDVSKFLNEYTVLLSVYVEDGQGSSLQKVEQLAGQVASNLEQVEGTTEARVLESFSTGVNPTTGEQATIQTGYSRYGEINSENELNILPSVLIGLIVEDGTDSIDYSALINEKIDEINSSDDLGNVVVAVSADNAPSILTQIDSLQNNLLTGLIAVALISFLLITWRASIITALFMVSVVAVTLLILQLIGYSLNTITLFALVLSLGLFVDDATIIVEAIDAGKAKKLRPAAVIREAIGKVGAASFAGTFTTVLVFLPMVFITGILGSFIRIMPVTIIIALITSLILSLTLIPVLSKYVLLNNSKKSYSILGPSVAYLADKISSLPLIFRKSRKKGYALTAFMISISFGFFILAMNYASLVSFNIFPPSKDSDQLSLNMSFEEGTTIKQAEAISDQVNEIILSTLEPGIVESVSYSVASNSGQLSNERNANALITLKPFTEREVKSPELIEKLQNATVEVEGAKIVFGQFDAGPPAEEFPFKAQVFTEDPEVARQIILDMSDFLNNAEVTRNNGTTATIDGTSIPDFTRLARQDGERYFQLGASFDADDVTALVQSAQTKVESEFNEERLATYGLTPENIGFDFGQESENQESFSSLGIVGLLSVGVMYLLLGLQFRSLVKPLLIFMAIPFSLLGVFAGLYYTDNPISFFVMVGLFGLIGIAVNNTILLTDYANQERRSGKAIVEAISEATKKRFRPLLTTSITTVVALLPLALSDPFWEALAFTIIFGLLSSTILVIVSFPYYYLLIEGLRTKVRARFARAKA